MPWPSTTSTICVLAALAMSPRRSATPLRKLISWLSRLTGVCPPSATSRPPGETPTDPPGARGAHEAHTNGHQPPTRRNPDRPIQVLRSQVRTPSARTVWEKKGASGGLLFEMMVVLRRASNLSLDPLPISFLHHFPLAPQAPGRAPFSRSQRATPSPEQPLTPIRISGGCGSDACFMLSNFVGFGAS